MEDEPDFQGMETLSFRWEYWVIIINTNKLCDKTTAEKMQHSTIGEETEAPGGTGWVLFGVRGTGETKVRGEDGVC